MRIVYEAYVGGDVVIDESDLEGKIKEEREEYISKMVTAAANEDLDSHLTWEIEE